MKDFLEVLRYVISFAYLSLLIGFPIFLGVVMWGL